MTNILINYIENSKNNYFDIQNDNLNKIFNEKDIKKNNAHQDDSHIENN